MLQNVCKNCVRILEEEAPSVSSVCSLSYKRSEKTGLLIESKREKSKAVHTPENITDEAESVCEAQSTSYQHRPQQLHISETSFRRILHKDLGMTPYKVQLVQKLKPIDHPKRFRFAKWACYGLTENADFSFLRKTLKVNKVFKKSCSNPFFKSASNCRGRCSCIK